MVNWPYFLIFIINEKFREEIQIAILLERALRALASSSGGAACPGGTQGQPQGRPQESGGDSKAI